MPSWLPDIAPQQLHVNLQVMISSRPPTGWLFRLSCNCCKSAGWVLLSQWFISRVYLQNTSDWFGNVWSWTRFQFTEHRQTGSDFGDTNQMGYIRDRFCLDYSSCVVPVLAWMLMHISSQWAAGSNKITFWKKENEKNKNRSLFVGRQGCEREEKEKKKTTTCDGVTPLLSFVSLIVWCMWFAQSRALKSCSLRETNLTLQHLSVFWIYLCIHWYQDGA